MRRAPKDEGTILITTLLIMAVIAALCVAILDDIRFAVKRTINVQDYAQADWYATGAEDFATQYLGAEFARAPDIAKNKILREEDPIIFPIESGVMTLSVSDGSHCFPLNSLAAASGQADATARRQFAGLLRNLALPEVNPERLAARVTDWIDSDDQLSPGGAEDGDYLRLDPPYRTANTGVSSVYDLRAVDGLDEAALTALRPFICAGEAGEDFTFNINTAAGEDALVLSTLMGGDVGLALDVIAQRPQQGYSEETLKLAPAFGGELPEGISLDQISYAPERLWIEVTITHRNAVRQRVYAFALDKARPRLTYRRLGRGAFRPVIKPPESGSDNG